MIRNTKLAKNLVVFSFAVLTFAQFTVGAPQQPEFVVQPGHTGIIKSMTITSDGRFLLTGSADSTAKLWDIKLGKEIRTFTGHSQGISSIAITSDNKYLVTGSEDETAKLWYIGSGTEIRTLKGHTNRITSVAIASNNKFLATGSRDETVKLWDINTGKLIRTLMGAPDSITSVAITADGRFLIAGCRDGTAMIWNVDTGGIERTLKGHFTEMHSIAKTSVAITSDNKYLVTGSTDGTVKLWDIETGREIKSFQDRIDSNYGTTIAITKDNKYIVTDSGDGVKLIDIDTGQEFRTFKNLSTPVVITPDNKYLIGVAPGFDFTVSLCDFSTGTLVKTFTKAKLNIVRAISLSSDDRYMIVMDTSWDATTAKLWDLSVGKMVQIFPNVNLPVAVTPDNQYILTGGNTITLWDIKSGEKIRTFAGHTDVINSLAITPDGQFLVTGSNDTTVKLWDIATGKEIRTFKKDGKYALFVASTSDGKYLIKGGSGRTTLWDLNTGKEVRYIKDPEGGTIEALTSDDKYFVTINSSVATLWDLNTGKEVVSFKGHSSPIRALTISHDNKYLVTGGGYNTFDNTARLWDIHTGKQIRIFKGHAKQVVFVALTSDDKFLVTGSEDGNAKLWDVSTGKEIRTFEGHLEGIASLRITSDDKYLITSSGVLFKNDGIIRFWDLHTGQEIAKFMSFYKKEYIKQAAIAEKHYKQAGSLGSGSDLIFTRENGYLIITPDGYYTATKEAAKELAWRMGQNLYPFDQFDLKYNRPDIVLERLGNRNKSLIASYKNAYLKRLKKMGLKEEDISEKLHIPEVKINVEDVAVTTSNRIFNLNFTAKDDKFKLSRVNVYVNGVAIFGIRGISLKEENTNLAAKTISIELSYGDNNIEVSALNEKGAESYKETLYVKFMGEYKKPDLYIFAIGTSKYKNPDYNLRYAAKDAEDIVQLFRKQSENGTSGWGVNVGAKNGKLIITGITATSPVKKAGLKTGDWIQKINSKPTASMISEKVEALMRDIKGSSVTLTVLHSGEKKPKNYTLKMEIESTTEKLFDHVFVLKLQNENSTKENIIKAKEFFNKSNVDDIAVLFVAGHGMVDNDQNYYYGTYDIDVENPVERGLPFEEFENLLDGIPARQKVIFVDTCFSGEIEKTDEVILAQGVPSGENGNVKVRSFKDKRGVIIKKKETETVNLFQESLFNDLRRGTGAVIISSSSGDEYSYEGEAWKNGVFTYSIIEGLKMKKSDVNKDNKIGISELRDYVLDRVKELTAGGQNPTVRRDNIENDFVVYE